MESQLDWHSARALLEWQVELGATEAILDAPVDRFTLETTAPKPAPVTAPAAQAAVQQASAQPDPAQIAKQMAETAGSLDALQAALAGFEYCELKRGARNLVFSDGNPAAQVMIVGEAPGRDEDQQGKPFVGRAGQLLDKMLAAIGLDRQSREPANAAYITNVVPWRPPQNREPSPDEIAMLTPFLLRHIALIKPTVVVAMGNISCQALLGKRGISKLRGQLQNSRDIDVIPMFHPAYLLRNPSAKKLAWADLLMLKAKLAAS
ncbi:MAG: uracil-DNA glycosylase [Marinovum sp.]|nr:uracil-DNA glycosylase [Marinovum sp.]